MTYIGCARCNDEQEIQLCVLLRTARFPIAQIGVHACIEENRLERGESEDETCKEEADAESACLATEIVQSETCLTRR